MRHSFSFLFILLLGGSSAQNIGINTNGAIPNGSALLDVDASALPAGQKRGLLIPRVALVATDIEYPVGIPIATSLLVYNTATDGTPPYDVTPGHYAWDGVMWRRFVMATDPPPETACPPGFVRVPGRNYCIEPDERSQANWYDANDTCMSIGARLCSWGEWHNACIYSTTTVDNIGNVVPMLNMTGENEWVMHPAATNSAHVVGLANCDYINAMGPATASPRFRCCFAFY